MIGLSLEAEKLATKSRKRQEQVVSEEENGFCKQNIEVTYLENSESENIKEEVDKSRTGYQ